MLLLASVRHIRFLLISAPAPASPSILCAAQGPSSQAPACEPSSISIHRTLKFSPVACNAPSKSPQNNHLVLSFNPSFMQPLTLSGNRGTRSLKLKSCANTTSISALASSSWIFRTVSIAASWSEKSGLLATWKKGVVGLRPGMRV